VKREQALVPVGAAAGIATYLRDLRESGGREFRRRESKGAFRRYSTRYSTGRGDVRGSVGKFTRIGAPFFRACEV